MSEPTMQTNGHGHHDGAFIEMLRRLDAAPRYEVPPTRCARLREELQVRSIWPVAQVHRTPNIGGGWLRLVGLGVAAHCEAACPPVGLRVGSWRVRPLAPALDNLRSGARFVWTGELR